MFFYLNRTREVTLLSTILEPDPDLDPRPLLRDRGVLQPDTKFRNRATVVRSAIHPMDPLSPPSPLLLETR